MRKKVLIFGLGELAKLLLFYLTNDSDYEVIAFTVDECFKHKDSHMGLPIIEFEQVEKYYPPNEYTMFIAIGYNDLNNVRRIKYKEAKLKGYNLGNYISSKSIYWKDMSIGDNCIILENNVIQPFATIGSNTIIWSSNLIGHDVKIGKNCFVSSHVSIGGNSIIEDNCFLGMNSSIRDKIRIGSNSIIGMGVDVSKNISPETAYIQDIKSYKSLDSKFLKHLL